MSNVRRQDVDLRDGALTGVVGILDRLRGRRVLLVYDEPAYEASGAVATLEPVLKSYQVSRFSDFELNPKLHDVQRGVELFLAASPDAVIALGGGTAIDLAKMINSFACQNASPQQLAVDEASITQDGRPLIAIPTTAGTGSEATHFAVVYFDGKKHSVAHPNLLPDYAVIDPLLTHSLPPGITATTGLDAFCQAIESIWAVGATDESVGYATESARLSLEYLEAAVHNSTDKARASMCRASHLAGKAINISKTTLPHAMSYAISADYGLPHGSAVAITLSAVLAFNADVSESDSADPRGHEHTLSRISVILELLGAEDVAGGCKRIEQLIGVVGCPRSLAQINANTEKHYRHIAEQVNAERLSNNPRRATSAALCSLLEESSSESTIDKP